MREVITLTLGNKLKNLREDSDLRQIDVAQKVNLGQVSISKYELDMSEPDLATLVKLADLFNVNIDYLLGHTETKTSWKDMNKVISIPGKSYSACEFIDMLLNLPEKEKRYVIGLMELFKQNHQK